MPYPCTEPEHRNAVKASNIAFLDETSRFKVREGRGDYDADSGSMPADGVEPFYQAQGLVGEALNLAGLLLVSLEDECDARAMQIHTAVRVIEAKLEEAYRRLDLHEIGRAGLLVDPPENGSD